MIIHTGMRTDIPAFYFKWFLNRLKEGYVLVRNPYNLDSVTKYRLDPSVVDLICFCTKNPGPMLKHMDALKDFGQYWFVTITPYGKDIEPHVPDKNIVMEDFKRLSDIVGIDSIGWRYYPILINEEYTVERHLRDFEMMAKNLCGYTKTCVISFIDIYKKVERNFPEIGPISKEDQIYLGKRIIEIAKKYGMTIRPCDEGDFLEEHGADCSGCMTKYTFETALHTKLNIPSRYLNQKHRACGCMLGGDIGTYDTCGHMCKYCYANTDIGLVKMNLRKHDPDSPMLTDELKETDIIHEAEQKSWIDNQLSLF